ncbi:biotin-dependent carboxyltransferase family protein [Herbaspirillum sp. 1130]|uniref:5-oxoprolinase subunit C family protein n=1 Tax=Herbaspirillum sp. 1130 TaxID=2806562 RepID=UPI001AE565E2|nr:biotin-dependent carboxyltransferase family protein [Herbaspirillum sp. 1130]MBP1318304.1 biotin-dependent carboxylase-like uncharacterized protein [Herbaspirillum sp. 1130]
MIEILTSGAPNVVQDSGRAGFLDIGVGRSGAMDAKAFVIANALVGNPLGAAVIEINLFPFKVRFQKGTVFACTGTDSRVLLDGKAQSPWWARRAEAGQVLTIEQPKNTARAYLAVGGGIDVPEIMGSRATDLKSGFGGSAGKGLRRGEILACGQVQYNKLGTAGVGVLPDGLSDFWQELATRRIRLRAIPAAEYGLFDTAAREAFVSTDYKITPDANRQGYRLSGEALHLREPVELFSHGIVPGTVQVPPSGQPIIQLAEANTCGGYPKIATVIDADLWRLAQAPIGIAVHFELISQSDAIDLTTAQIKEVASLQSSLELLSGRS